MLGSPDNGVPVLRTRDARKRRVLMPLLVLLVVGAIVLLVTGAGQRGQILGSGSTLAQPLIEGTANDYRNAANADNPLRIPQTGNDWVLDGSGIDYEPVGSLGGITRLPDPEVDFAVSDYPLSGEALQQQAVGQFPVAVGAIGVVHSLDLGGASLRLDAPTLANMYQGRVKTWNDPAIVALNPGTSLPATPIDVVHRADGSGSTFGFTRYLAAGSPEWAAGPGSGSLVAWPAGRGVERSGGMVEAVRATPGAIGYVEQGQAARAGLGVAHLKNAAGSFAAPDAAAVRAAMAATDFSGRDHYVDGLAPTDDPQAYPMSTAVYALLERDPALERDTRGALRYLGFVLDSSDARAESLGYVPLPENAAQAVKRYWAEQFPHAG